MLLNGKVCECNIAIQLFELINDLVAFDKGRFLVVHRLSSLSLLCQIAPPHHVEVENAVKFGVSRPCDKTN